LVLPHAVLRIGTPFVRTCSQAYRRTLLCLFNNVAREHGLGRWRCEERRIAKLEAEVVTRVGSAWMAHDVANSVKSPE